MNQTQQAITRSAQAPWRFSVAPMMDWTDHHCRFFHRLLSQNALLYTEMITTGAILRGNRNKLLHFNPEEHPIAVQIGGSCPRELQAAGQICQDFGYDEVNLNVGCPSLRVQNGEFGACLMKHPKKVAECVAALKSVLALPVTVKCRLGVDDQDPEESLFPFVQHLAEAGVDRIIVHARKAWLRGLSPKDNRYIPPLDYGLVYRLKQHFSTLPICINGGIQHMSAIQEHLRHVDGVMCGRHVYHHPEFLLRVDPEIFGGESVSAFVSENSSPDFSEIFKRLECFLLYIDHQLETDVHLHQMTRHLLGLFAGQPGSRAFRRSLAQTSRTVKTTQFLRQALEEQKQKLALKPDFKKDPLV